MEQLQPKLSRYALVEMGRFEITPDDDLPGRTLLLVGPDEPDFWEQFTASPEFTDGKPDPLDRWSFRVMTRLANDLKAQAYFPFGGPPHHPFIGWALRSGAAWPSPIGLLVHQRAGLFGSFRGALVLQEALPALPHAARPCDTCRGQPCASACPVNAFADGYDVAACKAHVASDAGHACRSAGCLARRACPVGAELRVPAQSAFHMEAFL